MRDAAGELSSLQFITPTGARRFLTDGRVAGCYFSIGRPDAALCIVEGFSTGASVHESTGCPVVCAMSAGNLEPVARALRTKYPDLRIIICADDDYRTDGNPGLTRATEAARAVGGLLAVPDFDADRPEGVTDFNDLARHRGAEAVERAVRDAKALDASEHQSDPPNAAASDSGLRVLTLAELLTHEFPEREPILKPFLLKQGLVMIHAWRGTGKRTSRSTSRMPSRPAGSS
jgi:putative DNA primase/helicase